jgi:PAS domain-containing protein
LEIASASRTLVRHIRHSYRRKADHEQITLFDAGRNDLEGRVVEPNDAFLGIPGYDSEGVFSGRVRWTELTPPEWRERDMHTLAELNSTGTVHAFRVRSCALKAQYEPRFALACKT